MTSNAQLPDQITGDFAVDPSLSTVAFRTRAMLGLLPVKGTFAITDGRVHVGEPHTSSTATLTVAAGSFASGNDKRDHHIASADFLHAEQHPSITFGSTRIATDSAGHGPVEGVLTVRGTQAPVTVEITSVTIADGTLVAQATARVDRTALGVSKGKGMVAKHVSLEFHIVATAV